MINQPYQPYFTDCASPQDVKTLYRRLAMRMHPDRGGETAAFQDMQQQYLAALKQFHGYTETGSDDKQHTYYYREETESAIMDKINELVALDMDDVQIRLIGTWIWVTGNTRPYAKQLGKAGVGLYWHRQRSAWVWHLPTKRRTKYNPRASLQDLEESYGSRDFSGRRHRSNGMTRTS